MDRIPSATTLAKRKLFVASTSCHSCDSGVDETSHVLMECSFTRAALG